MGKMIMEFFLTDIDYSTDKSGEPFLRLFGTTDQGKKVVAFDHDFRPYFWVLAEEGKTKELAKKIEKIKEKGSVRVNKVLETNIEKKKFLGKEIEAIKVVINHPRAEDEVRDRIKELKGFKEVKERGMSYYRRYLVDKDIYPFTRIKVEGESIEKKGYRTDYKIKIENIEGKGDLYKDPKYLVFDLEVYNYRINPRPEKDPILMISIDSNMGVDKVMTWKKIDKENADIYGSEMEMIQGFLTLIKRKQPDIIIGYNSDDFDFEYLRKRVRKYNLKLDLGLDGSKMKFVRRGRTYRARVKGITHVDLLPFVKRVMGPTLDTEVYDLNSVAEELLGREKKELDWESIWEMWDEGGEALERLFEYSINDANLTKALFEETKALQLELTKLIGLPLFDIIRMGFSQYVEWYLIRKAKEKDELIPNRPDRKEIRKRRSESFTGGYVYQPEPGLYDDIVIVDYRSLPPYEPIYLKDSSGRIYKKEIGEFVEGFLDNKETSRLNRQTIQGWKTLTYSPKNKKVCWKPIKAVIKHHNNPENLLEIQTEENKEITITPNHSILTLDDSGKLELVDADELEKDDTLILPRKIPTKQSNPTIDVISILSKFPDKKTDDVRLYIKRKTLPRNARLYTWVDILKGLDKTSKDTRELSEEVNRHIEVIRRNLKKMDKKGLVDYKSHSEIKITKKGRAYLNTLKEFKPFSGGKYWFAKLNEFKEKKIPVELKKKIKVKQNNGRWKRALPALWEINEKEALVFGLYISEGWVGGKDNGTIYFSNTEKKIIDLIMGGLKRFYPNLRYRKREDKTDEQVVKFRQKPMALLLLKLFGRKSGEKKINDLIFNLPRRLRTKIFEGMMRGDGNLGDKPKYTSKSKRLIKDLQTLLLTLGCCKTSFLDQGRLKDLYIYKKQIEGFKLGRNRDLKKEYHSLFLIPRGLVENSITQKLKQHHRGPRIDLKKVEANLKCDKGLPWELKFFKDCGISRIKKIEEKEYKGKVYDLSVKDTQTFFAGNGPVLVHNSLYPSIIYSHNISPSKLGRGKEHYESPEIEGKTYKFGKKEKGFIPSVLKGLIDRRTRIKNILRNTEKGTTEYKILKARSQALKTLANSSYGYYGFAPARWYCKECARSATAWGRKYIKDTIEWSQDAGFGVIYSDTDSCFLTLKEGQSQKDVFEFIQKVNKKLPGGMKLEFEGLYPRGIFVSKKKKETGAKKKYALIDKDGNLVIKGFEYVRRDWADIAKETQKEVLNVILKGEKEKAASIIRDVIKKIQAQEIDPKKMAIYTQLKKEIEEYESIGPHVMAAKKAKEAGYHIEKGSIIRYIVTKAGGERISDRSRILRQFKEEEMEYDPGYYIEHQLMPAVMRIMDVIGYSKVDVVGKGQTRLGRFES